jgi:hypothetical protein
MAEVGRPESEVGSPESEIRSRKLSEAPVPLVRGNPAIAGTEVRSWKVEAVSLLFVTLLT